MLGNPFSYPKVWLLISKTRFCNKLTILLLDPLANLISSTNQFFFSEATRCNFNLQCHELISWRAMATSVPWGENGLDWSFGGNFLRQRLWWISLSDIICFWPCCFIKWHGMWCQLFLSYCYYLFKDQIWKFLFGMWNQLKPIVKFGMCNIWVSTPLFNHWTSQIFVWHCGFQQHFLGVISSHSLKLYPWKSQVHNNLGYELHLSRMPTHHQVICWFIFLGGILGSQNKTPQKPSLPGRRYRYHRVFFVFPASQELASTTPPEARSFNNNIATGRCATECIDARHGRCRRMVTWMDGIFWSHGLGLSVFL